MKTVARADSCVLLQKGFTLLELLVAISIFGVIAAMVFTTFNAVTSRTGEIKKEAAISEMAAACLNRISMDLQGVYVEQYPLYRAAGRDEEPDPYRFEGEIDYKGAEEFSRLRFASTEHLPMSGRRHYPLEKNNKIPPGLTRIRYHVEQDMNAESNSVYVLKRGDKPFPYDDSDEADPEKDPVLCENITAFEFTYLDAEGSAVEKWDSEADTLDYATPVAVGVVLEIRSSGRDHRFSTRIVLPVYREPIESVKQ